MSETDVQARCKKRYRAVGCKVWDTSQKRRALITPGLPDLLVFHVGKQAFWFHEVKHKAPQTDEQQKFQRACEACGVKYLLGGVEEATDHLRELGLWLRAA